MGPGKDVQMEMMQVIYWQRRGEWNMVGKRRRQGGNGGMGGRGGNATQLFITKIDQLPQS